MSLYTQNGSRPDLAALPINMPEGFIWDKVLPAVPVADKTGTLYYAALTADSTAQTGRGCGTAPTATVIADSSTSFSCAEVIKRAAICPDEVKTMGGIEKADEVGSKWSKRQVQKYTEAAVANAVLGGTTFTAIASTAVAPTLIQAAIDSVRAYEGKLVIVGGTVALKKLALHSSVSTLLARVITGTSPDVAIPGMAFNLMLEGMAVLFGVDQVLAGDSTLWGSASPDLADRFAVAKVYRGEDVLDHKYQASLGKVVQFLPDGVQPFEVESVADLVNKVSLYDASSWLDVKTLNAGSRVILKLT